MSKKHFEWAAAYVQRLREAGLCAETCCQHAEDAYVALFRQFGPRFDEGRFRQACAWTQEDATAERIFEMRANGFYD